MHLLLIDDDAKLYSLLRQFLGANGMRLSHARDGAHGLDLAERERYDAVLLDVMMPGMDGLEVLRRIRGKWGALPVIMLTGKGDETDRVVGLELGADDYLPKPFSPRELLARVRAVLRRAQPSLQSERLAARDVEVDVGARSVLVEGHRVELTSVEFSILLTLMRRPGRVLSRGALLDEAGRSDVIVSERAIDVHVSHLRRKIADDTRTPRLIQTVRGSGYVLVKESG